MYASFRSVTAKNGKILTPTLTGKFLVDLNGPGILRDVEAGRGQDRETMEISWVKTKQGPGVHGPPLWTESMDTLFLNIEK